MHETRSAWSIDEAGDGAVADEAVAGRVEGHARRIHQRGAMARKDADAVSRFGPQTRVVGHSLQERIH